MALTSSQKINTAKNIRHMRNLSDANNLRILKEFKYIIETKWNIIELY